MGSAAWGLLWLLLLFSLLLHWQTKWAFVYLGIRILGYSHTWTYSALRDAMVTPCIATMRHSMYRRDGSRGIVLECPSSMRMSKYANAQVCECPSMWMSKYVTAHVSTCQGCPNTKMSKHQLVNNGNNTDNNDNNNDNNNNHNNFHHYGSGTVVAFKFSLLISAPAQSTARQRLKRGGGNVALPR